MGRDELIASYELALRRTMSGRPGKSIMPIGLRGVGKTVLLTRFHEIARRHDLRVGFIEAPESGDFKRLMASRLRSILLELDEGPVSRVVKRALGILKSFTCTLPDSTSIAVDVDAVAGQADSGILAEDTADLLIAVGEAARDRQSGVLIAIDELQYLDGEELGALISAIHRTVQLSLPIILVGAGLPQLPGLAGNAKSYAERLFEFPRIDSLNVEDARDVLAVPAREQEVSFTDDALDEIVTATHGYPYFLQEWVSRVERSPTLADRMGRAPRSSRRSAPTG